MLKRFLFSGAVVLVPLLLFMGATIIWGSVIPVDIPNDKGGWAWHDQTLGSKFGTVHVDCIHKDSKGVDWTSY